MSQIFICFAFLLHSFIFALAPEEKLQNVHAHLENMLALNKTLALHYPLLNTFIPSTPEIGPKEVLNSVFYQIKEGIVKYHQLSTQLQKIYHPKKASKSKRNKKRNKKKSLNPEKILAKLKISLDEITVRLNDYIFLQDKIAAEFHRILINLGPYSELNKCHIPIFLLQKDDAKSHYVECHNIVIMLITPFENYTKHLIDFFVAVKEFNPAIIPNHLAINLASRTEEDSLVMYSLTPEFIASFQEKEVITYSTKNAIKDYLLFIKINSNNNTHSIPFLQTKSKDLLWFVGKDNETSKLYTNLQPAKNGFLFALSGNEFMFDFYTSDEPVRQPNQWQYVGPLPPDTLILQGNSRFHASHVPLLRTTANFIEYDDISQLQAVINEIKEHGFLSSSVLLECISWLMSEDAGPIGNIMPPFYPEKLLKLKSDQERVQQELMRLRADRQLKKEFAAANKKISSEDYYDMLKNTLEGPGSLGNRMFKKCIKWFVKRQENKLEKSRQKGSHLQLEGATDESTQTVVLPHGKKGKSGLKKAQIKRRLGIE